MCYLILLWILECDQRDRALDKQSFITVQRYRNYRKPEGIDQIQGDKFGHDDFSYD